MLKKLILLFLVIMSTLSCERVFDSPFDPESSNYQEFIVETGSLDFGSNNLYSGLSKNVKLYNTTNNKIIVSISSSSVNFKGDTSLTISADSYVDLKVYFMPTEAKTYTGTITADAGTLGKKTISLTGVGKTTISTDSLVAYYSFDGNTSDSSGNGHTGSNHDAGYTSSGKINGAYDFDGYYDYIYNLGIVSGANVRTYSFWVKSDLTSYSSEGYIYSGGSIGSCNHYGIAGKSTTWQFTDGVAWYNSGVSITTNWTNIVLVTESSKSTKIYINGNYITTFSHYALTTGTSNSVLGRYLGGSCDFNGLIDEVGIWNKALNQRSVEYLYNSGNGRSYCELSQTPNSIFSISNIDFNYVPKSKSSSKNIIIKNNTNFPISITGITYPSCFAGASSINVGASDSTTLAVTFAPTEANKDYSDTLKLATDIGVTYNVALSGTSIFTKYQIIEQSKTWSAAKTYCENLGGHLVTITSADEMTTISNLIGSSHPNYWIGATDEAVEGTWKWVTGEAWSYTNWYSGEPNNSSGNEDQACIQSNRTDWNDGRGSSSLYFICEYESLTYSGVDFGYTPKSKSKTKTITLKNNTSFPINITSIIYPDCFSGASNFTVPASDSINLDVTFVPSEADSTYSSSLKLISDIGVSFNVPVSGTSRFSGDIFTVNSTVLGYVAKGKSYTQNITIKNNTGYPINITSIIYPNCFSGASSLNVSANADTTLAVTFAPTEANKSYSGTLKLITDIGVTYNVVLSGTSVFSGEYEDFEDNNATNVFSFVGNWEITNEGYNSSYSLKSNSIGNNSSTSTCFTLTSTSVDTISFYYKTSTESSWDKLIFKINGIQKLSVSGSNSWTRVAYRLSSGNNTLTWTYSKDGSRTAGSDCVWIDNVRNNDDFSNTPLTVSNLDFGYVPKNRNKTQNLVIKNSSNFPISITGIIYPSCFTGASSANVPAKDSVNLSITFAPTTANTTYSNSITLSTDIEITHTATLSGTSSFDENIFTLSNADFEYVAKDSNKIQNLTIKNNTSYSISITNIAYPSCFSGASSINVPASDSVTLAVTFTPTVADKNYKNAITFTTDIDITYSDSLFGTSDDGLVTHYAFENNATDSENGNNGTISGATYTSSGKVNGAYNFDGSNDYIQVPNDLLSNTQPRTISAWFKLKDYNLTDKICIFSATRATGEYLISLDNQKLNFGLRNSSSWTNIYSDKILNTNWHHVVASWDGSVMKLYLDGICVATTSFSGSLGGSDNNTAIGALGTLSGNFFYGYIDEFRIWSRALTQTEITSLYNAGNN